MPNRITTAAALAALMLVALARSDTPTLAQGAPTQISPPSQQQPQYGAPPPQGQYNPPPQGQYNPPPPPPPQGGEYGATPPGQYGGPPPAQQYEGPPPEDSTYSSSEIIDAGHRFFGRVSMGLARVVEYAFSRAGRPNGYILGEEAGGAFVAGLRYGEGTLYTKDAGEARVYWQGPSVGWDFGAEGSKTMILVYSLHNVNDIYNNYAGIDGSAYFIGGVGITFMSRDHVTLAPIRSGVGLRLGANIGYLKFTRAPTWNPF